MYRKVRYREAEEEERADHAKRRDVILEATIEHRSEREEKGAGQGYRRTDTGFGKGGGEGRGWSLSGGPAGEELEEGEQDTQPDMAVSTN